MWLQLTASGLTMLTGILLLVISLLGGCTEVTDTVHAKTTAKHIQFDGTSARYVIQEACIDGVVYYLFDRGITPKFNASSQVVTCESSRR